MSIGNRVFLKRPMPSQELLEGFVGLPAANIADTMGRSCAMNPRIRLMSGFQGIMAGPALTVKARAGDNLFLHQALDMAQPGDVIVLSNDEDTTRSLMGEIMFTYAKYQKKLGGLVIDGPVRDVDALREMDLPVYATGSTPGGFMRSASVVAMVHDSFPSRSAWTKQCVDTPLLTPRTSRQ